MIENGTEPEIMNYRLQKTPKNDETVDKMNNNSEIADWEEEFYSDKIPDFILGMPVLETKTFYGGRDHPILGQNGEFFWSKCTVEQFGARHLRNQKYKLVINQQGQKQMEVDRPDEIMVQKSKSIPKDNLNITNVFLNNRPIMSSRISEKIVKPKQFELGSSLNKDMTYLVPKFPLNALTYLTPSCDAFKPDPNAKMSEEKSKIMSNMCIWLVGQSTIYGDINQRLENPEYVPKKPKIVKPLGFTRVPLERADYDTFRHDI